MTDVGVGNRCNSCCVMCTAVMPPKPGYKEPTTEEIKREIDNVKDGSILLTGGEPTIREDLFEILAYINDKHPDKRIELVTNGRMCCYPEFMKRLERVKNLRVITELHAAESKLHDEITKSPGSFRQAYEGINNLLESGFKVEFRIVVSKLNYKEVPRIAEMVVREFDKVDRVVIFPIDLIGNAFVNKEKVAVRYTELAPYVERGVKILYDAGVKVELYHIPYCVIGEDYHKFINKGMTVLERRVVLSEVCKGCRFEDTCPRVWKTYAVNMGMGEFQRIK